MLHIGWRPRLPQETAFFIGGAQIILLLLLYFPRPPFGGEAQTNNIIGFGPVVRQA